LAQNLNTKDLIKEISTINWFLANEHVPSPSVFKREEYRQAA
jgi:hypothetical protein